MLAIKHLSHKYPNGVQALNNINLDIPKGMFGLLGPNGAGKSSLMRTLATLQQPTSGDIRLEDINLLSEPESVRRVLGYLPQDFGVYPRGSALRFLDHIAVLKGLTDKKERKKVVEGLLLQTNLFEVRNKRLATFSGGMRQRFGIAQALIGKPKLIIVDEPTAGLDPEERNRFHNLLSEIGEEVAVILSTHIVEDVSDLCPNMAIMSGGEIVSAGTPASLVRQLEGQIWEKEIAKANLKQAQAEYKVISNHLCAGRSMIRVHSKDQPGEGFASTLSTLEDVYFLAVNQHRSSNSSDITD